MGAPLPKGEHTVKDPMLLMAALEDREALDSFLAENQLPWETLAGDDTQELAEKYSVRGIPTMMVVDKEGKILGVAHQIAALRPIVEKALK